VALWARTICARTICPRTLSSHSFRTNGAFVALVGGSTLLSGEAFLTTRNVAFVFLPLERLSRISVLATRSPVAPALREALFGSRSSGFR
jgi:hypothetical protein